MRPPELRQAKPGGQVRQIQRQRGQVDVELPVGQAVIGRERDPMRPRRQVQAVDVQAVVGELQTQLGVELRQQRRLALPQHERPALDVDVIQLHRPGRAGFVVGGRIAGHEGIHDSDPTVAIEERQRQARRRKIAQVDPVVRQFAQRDVDPEGLGGRRLVAGGGEDPNVADFQDVADGAVDPADLDLARDGVVDRGERFAQGETCPGAAVEHPGHGAGGQDQDEQTERPLDQPPLQKACPMLR